MARRQIKRLLLTLICMLAQQSLWVCAQTLTLLDNTASLTNVPSSTISVSSLQQPKIFGVVVSTNSTFYLSRIDLALTSGTGE